MRELLETLGIVALAIACALLCFWMGIGVGLSVCVDAGDRGDQHKFMKQDTKVLCVIKGEQ